MRTLVLSALLSTLAVPALAQATLQLTPQGLQVVDPQQQQQRDAARDAARDAERDARVDAERRAQYDNQRAGGYDSRQVDGDRRYDERRSDDRRDRDDRYANGNDGHNDGWRDGDRGRVVYGYNGRDERRDWRYEGQRYQTGSPYYHPRGYSYRVYNTGSYLPKSYWQAQRYWIANPANYRLSPTWNGVRWVRVGNDALLVRTINGAILSTVRGLFY